MNKTQDNQSWCPDVYSLSTDDVTFALMEKSKFSTYGYEINSVKRHIHRKGFKTIERSSNFSSRKTSSTQHLSQKSKRSRHQQGFDLLLKHVGREISKQIAESAGIKMLKAIMSFGTVSSTTIRLFMIIRVVKMIINVVIHGYTLKSLWGLSSHILEAIWSLLTHLLIHLEKLTNNESTAQEEEDIQLIEPLSPNRQPTPVCKIEELQHRLKLRQMSDTV